MMALHSTRDVRFETDHPGGFEDAQFNLHFGLPIVRLPIKESVGFRVVVLGRARALRSLIDGEVCRIARQGLLNACRHSGATAVEIELEYGASYLRMTIRDNGKGITSQALRSRQDLYGDLSQMRNWSERVGGSLKLFSHPARGTEFALAIPSEIAFDRQPESLAWKTARKIASVFTSPQAAKPGRRP